MESDYSFDDDSICNIDHRNKLLMTVMHRAIQRNDTPNALLAACEYSNRQLNIETAICNLKYRLMIICCEDIPNLFLIERIYKQTELEGLLEYISSMCEHTKTQEANLGLRIACERFDFDPLSKSDSLISLLRKSFTSWCASNGDYETVINEFGKLIDTKFKLIDMFRFLLKDIRFITVLCYYVYNEQYSLKRFAHKTINDVMNMNISISKLALKNIPEYATNYESLDYKIMFDNTILVPHIESTIEREAKKLYIETHLTYASFIRQTDIKNDIDITKVHFKQFKPSKRSVTQVFVGRTVDKASIYMNKLKLTNFILKGPIAIKALSDGILISDMLKRKVKLRSAHYMQVLINSRTYIAGTSLFKITSIKPGSVRECSLNNVEIYKHNTYQLVEHDILDMSDNTMLTLMQNVAHRFIVGCNVTEYRNFILYHGNISSVDDRLEYSARLVLFTTRLHDKVVSKIKRYIKHNFILLADFVKQYIPIIKHMKDISITTKIYLTKRTMQLLRRSNWIVS